MYPVYRCMDSSFPYQRTQMPCRHPYFPISEAVTPQMKVDPAKYPIMCESWPFGGHCAHSVPMGWHGCCNQNYFPDFCNFRPPYPHFPQHSPFNCPGSYPAVPEAHPVSYPAFPVTYPVIYSPPPQFSNKQPIYEYDKSAPRDHCCGYPNHLCHKRDNTSVKIEEQDPDVQKKGSDTYVPNESRSYPYPVMWMPPNYIKNIEPAEPVASELEERDMHSGDAKACKSWKSCEQEPNLLKRWFPLDMDSLGSLKDGGDERRPQNRQNEDRSQFPLPIFWIPYKPNEGEGKDPSKSMTRQELDAEPFSNFKIAPVTVSGGDDRVNQPVNEENSVSKCGSKMMGKDSNQKMIPVKQLELNETKGSAGDAEGKSTALPVKHIADSEKKKPSENGARGRSSSPIKSSKLPPVCLRVDPLPKKKNGNGSSRSPSPPHKGSQDLAGASSKSPSSSSLKGNVEQDMEFTNPMQNKTTKAETRKREKEASEVVEGTEHKREYGPKADTLTKLPDYISAESCQEGSTNQSTSKAKIDDGKCNVTENKGVGDKEEMSSIARDAAVECQSGNKEFKIGGDQHARKVEEEEHEETVSVKTEKNLSEVEAAVIIQSAYRGFEVRKRELLKKLRQIAQVREQAIEVRSRIEALEFSPNAGDDREKVVIGETIMSLLLKLDTIQGLHTSVRDIRKSVVKDLVSLQEKLDSLAIKTPGFTVKTSEDFSTSTRDNVCTEGEEIEAEEAVLNCFESNNDKSDSVESFQCQSPGLLELLYDSQDVETLGLIFSEKEESGEFEDKTTEFPVLGKPEQFMKQNDEVKNEVLGDGQLGHSVEHPLPAGAEGRLISEMQNKSTDELELGQSVEMEKRTHTVLEKREISSLVDNSGPDANVLEMDQLAEQPQEIPDKDPGELCEEPAVDSWSEQIEMGSGSEQVGKGICEVSQAGEMESDPPIDATQLTEVFSKENKVEQQAKGAIQGGPVNEKSQEKDVSDNVEDFLEDGALGPKVILAQAQGEKISTDELVEVARSKEEEIGLKAADEYLGHDELETLKLAMPLQGEISDIYRTSRASSPEESQPEVSSMDNEVHDGEHKEEITDVDYNISGLEAFGLEKPQPELPISYNEMHDEYRTTDTDNSSTLSEKAAVASQGSEVQVPIEQSKECSESLINDQELAEGRLENEELDAVAVANKVINQCCGTQTVEQEQTDLSYGTQPVREELLVPESSVPVGAEEQGDDGEEAYLVSPTASQVSLGSNMGSEWERKLMEEHERLRDMMERLIEAGKEQLASISNLSGRVKDLEKKLSRKKRLRTNRFKAAPSGSSCAKKSNDFPGRRDLGFAC